MQNPVIILAIFFSLLAYAPSANAENIDWSNQQWEVRGSTGGPGPNTFAKENVSVAQDGTLHLRISKRDSQWTCAELSTLKPLGFGTYQWSIQTPVDHFDRNVVLGLFSYPAEDVGPDGTNEIDIEFSRWGNPKHPNGNYTVYPVNEHGKTSETTFDFKLKDPSSIHRYEWKQGAVAFESLDQSANSIARWSTPEAFAPKVGHSPMPVHINLWLFKSKPPGDGKDVEVVITNFQFTPANQSRSDK